MEGDAFGSLIIQCQPTSSQEEKFENCPFARESEVFPGGQPSQLSETDGTSEELTGIIMVSPPDSSDDACTLHEEEDDFQTPSGHSLSLLSSSEDQGQIITAVDSRAGQQIDGVGDGETTAADDGCADTERTVDLGKVSENLGFSGPKLTPIINCGADRVELTEFFESESKKFGDFQGEEESGEPQSKKPRVSEENLCLEIPNVLVCDNNLTDTVIVESLETNCNENGVTEGIESEFGEAREGLVDRSTANTMNVNMPVRETEEGGKEGKCLEGRRELPFSIRAQEKNVFAASSSSSAKNQLFIDLLDSLKLFAKELRDGSEELDFLESVKKRGVTFPQPRWWPPEGFDD